MPMLDAALAFALTMMALASITTLIMELIHRFFRLRSKGMRNLLEKLFEKEVAPRLMVKAKGAAEISKEAFLDKMLANPLITIEDSKKVLRSVENLSAEEFWQRLGSTDIGKELKALKAQKVTEFEVETEHLAQKFDEYSRAASDYFERRAKMCSLVIGVALAFVINANAVDIWDAYLTNPSMTQAVIDSSDEYEDLVSDAVKRAEEHGDEATVEELETYQSEIRALILKVEHQGLPIGYEDPSRDWRQYPLSSWRFWRTLLALILTGLLLGLGGPFWFNIVVRLGQVRQAFSGGGIDQGQGQPSAGTLDGRYRLLEQGAFDPSAPANAVSTQSSEITTSEAPKDKASDSSQVS